MGGIKADIQKFWDQKLCGSKFASSPQSTRAFFAEIEADRYSEEFHIPLIAEFDCHRDERVLEVGCGLGTDGRQFAKGGARYVGCDLSPESLRMARSGFGHFGLAGHFTNCDAEDLPFSNASFDLVYSHGVLHHTPGTAEAVREIYRVLRPRGKAIVMLYNRYSLFALVGIELAGRLRLAYLKRRIGERRFRQTVGLPDNDRGPIPHSIVINNSTDGIGNPLSKLYSRDEVRHLFRDFQEIETSTHYFPKRKVPIVGPLVPRFVIAAIGQFAGSFLYVKARKPA